MSLSSNNLPAVVEPESIRFIGAVHPLKVETVDIPMPVGMTVLEMLEAAQPDPVLLQDATVFIDDIEIKPEYWHVVKPRVGHVVSARIIPYLHGGGGGGGKSPLRTILTIAVIAASFYFGPILGAQLGLSSTALFTVGTIEVSLASLVGGAIISVAGNLLVNAIAPIRPPSIANLSGAGVGGVAESPSLFIEGSRNTARPFAVVPSVLGFFRFRPPLGAKTFTEVLGDSNRLRMLLVVGLGEVEISALEIGNTPIEDFEDFTTEIRDGAAGDDPITLYTNQIEQDEFSIALTQVSGFHQRTSDLNADELSIDLTFPRGLVTFSNSGSRGNRTVVLTVEFRKVGDAPWLPIPAGFTTTLDDDAINGTDVTISGARTVAVRHGIKWATGERAQYEVRVSRTTADTESTKIFDLAFWATLRTITDEDPILFPLLLAKIAIDIRATDQINGLLDELSVLAKSVVLDWDTDTQDWVSRVSNNPASLFRHVLQGPGKVVSVPDSEIDLVKLQEWHEFCVAQGFTFNMIRDFSSAVVDVLADIASAGRAGLDNVDGKWSVIIDKAVTITSTHISPRNSSNFEAEKSFIEPPHGWRIRFPNENERFKQDERIVYRDGFNAGNATLFEAMEFPGITNPDHIFKQGRYFGSVIVQRPERWTVVQDFESLVTRRGKRVAITHDVLLIGLASGRISALAVNGGGDVISITIDEPVDMEAGKDYGLSIRRDVDGDVTLSVPVDGDIGEGRTVLIPTTPIPMATVPEVGDMFGFGEVGQETEDALVLGTVPQTEFAAKITLVPYRDVIFDVENEAVLPYVANVTEDVFLPAAVIAQITTDESVLERGVADTTIVTAEIQVVPINTHGVQLEVQQRFSGTLEPFYTSDFIRRGLGVVRVKDIKSGETWDFRVRWNEDSLLPGLWTRANNVTIVGKSTPPSALVGMTISVYGGQVLIRWDEPSELDVRFGGQVRFRHSQSFSDPPWQDSVSIGDAANTLGLFNTLPLKPGTYLARVFDSEGNPSTTTTSVSTKQASVLTYAPVASLDEAPSFSGTHTDTVAIDGELKIVASQLIDSILDWDLIFDFDSAGGFDEGGTYDFDLGLDLGTVKRVRLTTRVTATSETIIQSFDQRTNDIDTWEDFEGILQASADVQIWVRHTDDDPSGTPVWTDYERLDSAEFEARGFDFQARLTTDDPAVNIVITELGIDAEEI